MKLKKLLRALSTAAVHKQDASMVNFSNFAQ